MRALITGASSGIGRDMAFYLSDLGWDLILTGRNEKKLNEISERLSTDSKIIALDLSKEGSAQQLYHECRGTRVDMLVNNAGFGIFGQFDETDLDKELDLINVNIKAVHILTKLFLRDFKKRNRGIILNVASSAAFMPGPLLSSYYASKAYVLRLSCAIYEELRRANSRVSISVLCPGPVDTAFNERAGVSFSIKPLSADYVARYAIDNALKGKLFIIPTFKMKLCCAGSPFVPTKIMNRFVYHIQEKKIH